MSTTPPPVLARLLPPPAEVTDALASLQAACAAWPKVELPYPSQAFVEAGRILESLFAPALDACIVVADPAAAFVPALVLGALLGVLLTLLVRAAHPRRRGTAGVRVQR